VIGAALVLGMARSGEAAAAALEARGKQVVRVDRTLGNDGDLALLDGVGVLVKSPGVPGEHPLVQAARARGVEVWSEVELGYRLHPERPIVGVTGTNGKTTTAELLGAIFRADGRDVAVAGNVGRPLSAVDQADWVVCELSSFQLEDVHELACRVAVLLNLEPDHLDRHGTFEAYRDAKLRIFERADTVVIPEQLRHLNSSSSATVRTFEPSDELPAEPLIPGRHNRENAAAATAAARAVGIPDEAIAEALRTFPGVEHRLELVAERDGVRFVNDSKATNTAAARRALAAYPDRLHLILGGSRKGESFEELAREIAARGGVDVLLIGEAAPELAAALDRAGVAYEQAGTLERAVRAAAGRARAGEIVLLSPACASFDQFENFERRGEEYRRLVQNLGG
jgi:UDP-N-acetylmuramoylalanine--D-glutamate ligase